MKKRGGTRQSAGSSGREGKGKFNKREKKSEEKMQTVEGGGQKGGKKDVWSDRGPPKGRKEPGGGTEYPQGIGRKGFGEGVAAPPKRRKSLRPGKRR